MGKRDQLRNMQAWFGAMMRMAQKKFEPYEEVGLEAVEKMAEEAFSLETSPLFEYAMKKGLKIINQQLAAKGLSRSGAGMGEVERFTEEMLFQYLDRKWGQWAQLASTGFTATSNIASLIASEAATQMSVYQWSQEMEMAGAQSAANLGMGIGGSMMGMMGGMMSPSISTGATAQPQTAAAQTGVSMAIPRLQTTVPTLGTPQSYYYPRVYG